MADIFYDGTPWRADEDEYTVRVFRDDLQIFKAPKRETDYAEYWPCPEMLVWMLARLNEAEAAGKTPPDGSWFRPRG